MRKPKPQIASPTVTFYLCFIFAALFVVYSYYKYLATNEVNWLAASGGVVSILGFHLMSYRKTKVFPPEDLTWLEKEYEHPGHPELKVSLAKFYFKRSVDLYGGYVLTFFGILLWAYAFQI